MPKIKKTSKISPSKTAKITADPITPDETFIIRRSTRRVPVVSLQVEKDAPRPEPKKDLGYARQKPKEQKFYYGLPWQKQPWETSESYMNFCTYLTIGPGRTVAKLIELMLVDQGKDVEGFSSAKIGHMIKLWSGEYEWKKRANFLDQYQEEISRRIQVEEIRKMHKRHADKMSEVFSKAVAILSEKLEEDPAEISIDDIRKIVDTSIKWERAARGCDDKKQAVNVSVSTNKDGEGLVSISGSTNGASSKINLDLLSDEQLKTMIEIKRIALAAESTHPNQHQPSAYLPTEINEQELEYLESDIIDHG